MLHTVFVIIFVQRQTLETGKILHRSNPQQQQQQQQ